MEVYLVQHGAAKSKQEDPERSLSEKGLADTRRVAAYVAPYIPQLQRIVHSGKTRARQTAEVLAEALDPADGVSQTTNLAPMDDPTYWRDRLNAAAEAVMLVGHLPHLSKLAALLICEDEAKKVVDFQNAGVVCLARDEDGAWAVRWIVTPQVVG